MQGAQVGGVIGFLTAIGIMADAPIFAMGLFAGYILLGAFLARKKAEKDFDRALEYPEPVDSGRTDVA